MGLPPKNLYNKHFENMSIFIVGLHPYKLATLRVTIGLNHLVLSQKTYQNRDLLRRNSLLWRHKNLCGPQ